MTVSKPPSTRRTAAERIPPHRPVRSAPPPVLGSATSDPSTALIALPDTDSWIQPQVSLANLTSFRVGGPAEFYIAPRTPHDLAASVAWADAQKLPVTIIGAGSNLLISDRGLPGLVICTRYLRSHTFDEETAQITAAAGEPIVRLAWQAAERGWSGLEWAVGIPGTVGGAVVMNAGAHEGCTADVLATVHVLNLDGTVEVLSAQQLGFAYRTSILQSDRRLLTQATFQLTPHQDPQTVMAATRRYLDYRHSTQPYHLPSCGSVFRNPKPQSAGWLIEQTGLKGYRIGGAEVAQQHANFILNVNGATAQNIYDLIYAVQAQVQERWNVCLHPEVKLLGQF